MMSSETILSSNDLVGWLLKVGQTHKTKKHKLAWSWLWSVILSDFRSFKYFKELLCLEADRFVWCDVVRLLDWTSEINLAQLSQLWWTTERIEVLLIEKRLINPYWWCEKHWICSSSCFWIASSYSKAKQNNSSPVSRHFIWDELKVGEFTRITLITYWAKFRWTL